MTSKSLTTRRALWQQRLDDWQQSQLSVADWCRQQQLPEHQFFYWKRKLMPHVDNKLLPVVANKPVASSAVDKMTVHLSSGLRIEVESADIVALIRQLEAL